MDRNFDCSGCICFSRVALRKESVDRNTRRLLMSVAFLLSLSARRAWIEIGRFGPAGSYSPVALRKESVDRNFLRSPFAMFRLVALRKESVDRNLLRKITITVDDGSLSARRAWIEMISRLFRLSLQRSLSARRAWIEMLLLFSSILR